MSMEEMYQEIILDHYRRPRNFGPVDPTPPTVEKDNPNCGDRISMRATVENGVVTSVRFDGHGCAICMASCSMLTEQLTGLPVEKAKALAATFTDALRQHKPMDEDTLGDLIALEGVAKFPMRVKCATLGWHALLGSLEHFTRERAQS